MDTVALFIPPIVGAVIGAVTALSVEWYRSRLRTLLRYRESQFNVYNELWVSLHDLRFAGDCLWEAADASNLERFVEQLEKTRVMISKSALLIEEGHLEELHRLIGAFGNYQLGKERLIELRKRRGYREMREQEIEEMIHNNQQIKHEYEHLLLDIAQSLKRQLRRP